MTQGFIERIERPTVIVRLGDEARRHGNRFRRSVFGEVLSPTHVMLKAYDDDLDNAYFQAVMRELYAGGFTLVTFERIGPPHRWIEVDTGPRGAIRMRVIYSKEPSLAAQ